MAEQGNWYQAQPAHSSSGGRGQGGGQPSYGTTMPGMAAAANPNSHPDNQRAARGSFGDDTGLPVHGSYVQSSAPSGAAPGRAGSGGFSVEQLKTASKKASDLMNNMWTHLSTGGAVTDNAWGRMTAGTTVLKKGGFEAVFKSTFPVETDETLRKTYACFLSTDKGPVGGTLYISSKKLAFCSDRPLTYTTETSQASTSYYRVAIPVSQVKGVEPSSIKEKPNEKYILVTTQDGVEFWFMGFVNYDKGVKNLQALLGAGTPSATTTSHQRPPPPPYDHTGSSYQSSRPPNQHTAGSSQQTYPPYQSGTPSATTTSHQRPPPPPYDHTGSSYQPSRPPSQHTGGSSQQTYPPNQSSGGSFQQVYPPNQSPGGSFHQFSPSHQPAQPNVYPPNQYGASQQPQYSSFPPNQYGTR